MDKLKQKTTGIVLLVISAYLCIVFAQFAMINFQIGRPADKFVLLVIAVLFGYLLCAFKNGTFAIARKRWSEITASAREGVFTDGDCVYSCNPPAAKKVLRSQKIKRIVSLLVLLILAYVFCFLGLYTQPLLSAFSFLAEFFSGLGKWLSHLTNQNLFFSRASTLYPFVGPYTLQYFLLTIIAWWCFRMHFRAGVRSPIPNKVGTPANV